MVASSVTWLPGRRCGRVVLRPSNPKRVGSTPTRGIHFQPENRPENGDVFWLDAGLWHLAQAERSDAECKVSVHVRYRHGVWKCHPGDIVKSVERTCAHCGATFSATQEHRNFKRKFCSKRCSNRANSERQRAKYPPLSEVEWAYREEGLSDLDFGARHGRSYQWAMRVRRHHGVRLTRDEKLRARRLKTKRQKAGVSRAIWNVREKGETCCRVCRGSHGGLHLHHVIPRSMHRGSRMELRNGIVLCNACHTRWHARTLTIYRDVFTAEEWAYISSVELLGQNIEAWLDARYPSRLERVA